MTSLQYAWNKSTAPIAYYLANQSTIDSYLAVLAANLSNAAPSKKP